MSIVDAPKHPSALADPETPDPAPSSPAPAEPLPHDKGSLSDTRPVAESLGVALRGVGQNFGTTTVLRDIDLDVSPGEIVAILGPSGCGKSTLLRAIAGLDRVSTGDVLIDGTPVDGLDARCGVGFQEPRLLPWRSVRRNVELGVPRGVASSEGTKRVSELLALTGLSAAADRRPREISGGMAQRASLARALARRPGVLLLDEPFGALDALTRLRMQELLLDLHAAHATTVLLVTHDVDEALRLADRVVVLGRSGTQAGAPAGITEIHTVTQARPRADEHPELVALRHRILGQLGVHLAA